MDTKTLSDLLKWVKTTDLTELVYKKDGQNIEIRTKDALPAAQNFDSVLSPLLSPAVGIYRNSKKGKMARLKEEQKVKKGDFMGVVEMPGSAHEILSDKDGTLKIISISDGKPVEYGQPLFFIEPLKHTI